MIRRRTSTGARRGFVAGFLGAAAVLAGASLSVVPGVAAANPTVWTRARSPAAARADAALTVANHEAALERFTREQAPSLELPEDIAHLHRLRTLAALQAAGAETSHDPLLLDLLGRVLLDLDEHRQAIVYLRRLLADPAADASLRSDAYANLAICQGHLGALDEEIAAYEGALSLEPHGRTRAQLLANQAEAFMVKGDVTRAIAGYRASLESLSSAELPFASASTFWSLGVALDRSGDLEGALTSVSRARSYDPRDLSLQPPGWFFVPDYDASWYAALGDLLVARNAKDLWTRQAAYEQSITEWGEYIHRAGDRDHYVALARARLALVTRESKALEKKLQHVPRPEETSGIRRLGDPQ